MEKLKRDSGSQGSEEGGGSSEGRCSRCSGGSRGFGVGSGFGESKVETNGRVYVTVFEESLKKAEALSPWSARWQEKWRGSGWVFEDGLGGVWV